MYASAQMKGNRNSSGSSCGSSYLPSDSEAMEKLVVYVYEYLLHQGATRTAQTFLSEIHWDKSITLNDPPGFLVSWWSVFYDLYCAAPERRDSYLHSPEAKAFHDQVSRKEASAAYPERPASNVPVPNMPNSYYHSPMRPSPSLSAPLGSPHLGSSPLPHHSPQAVMPGPYLGNQFPATPGPSMPILPQALSSGNHLQLSSQLKQAPRNQQALPYHSSSSILPAMHGMSHPGISPKSPLPSGPLRTPAHRSPRESAPPYGLVAGAPPRLLLPDGSDVLESAQDDPTESVAIQRIKESMKEEVKKLEKEHVEYFQRH